MSLANWAQNGWLVAHETSESLRLPPRREHLRWHRREVFRGPGREAGS